MTVVSQSEDLYGFAVELRKLAYTSRAGMRTRWSG